MDQTETQRLINEIVSCVADENEAAERCGEAIGFCDEDDKAAQAGAK